MASVGTPKTMKEAIDRQISIGPENLVQRIHDAVIDFAAQKASIIAIHVELNGNSENAISELFTVLRDEYCKTYGIERRK